VEVSRDVQDVEAFLTTLRNITILGGLGATAIAMLVSTIMAAWISRPIRELEGMARAIANRDFHRRVKWRRQDELGSLASGLNCMADQLASTIETLSSQQAHLRAVLDNLRDGVVALDAAGEVALFNTAAQAQDFTKLNLRDLAGLLADGKQIVEEEWIQGERTIGLTIAPILEENGRRAGTLIVMRDVTRLHEIERMRQRFISNVSHDLRTPLTSIKGFVSNMLDEGEPNQVRALTVIDEETDRLIRLVNELLELSRLQAGDLTMERRPIDLVSLAEKSGSLMQARAQRLGISLRVRVARGLPRVLADPDRIEQVIVNLLDNALKFTPPGGEVTLEVGRAPDQTGESGQMAPFESRNRLHITVTDNGPGLSEDELAHAFDRLFQGKGGRAKSAGLGLSIAQEIIQAHGGQIEIANRPAGGAAVRIFLPAIRGI
jgi:signal transduction histidine kinase